MMPTIAAVIPTYNSAATIDQCLASLRAQTQVPDEIVVVDVLTTYDTRATVGRPGSRAVGGLR